MKRKNLVTGCIMLMLAGMTGCGNTDELTATENEIVTETTEETDNTSEAESEEETSREETTEETSREETTQEESTDLSALSDDLYSYQIMINGEIYQIPMSVSDFEAMGWKYAGDEGEELDAYTYTGVLSYVKGDYDVEIDIVNLADSPKPYSECEMVGISVDKSYNSGNDITFILPKGIQSGVSTLEDVKAAYGEPASEVGDDEVMIADYVVEYAHKQVSFTFYDGVLACVSVDNSEY